MKKNLKYYLKGVLNAKELGLMPTSFDTVGSIMIFAEFPKELIKKEKLIGNIILEHYKNIKTILRKTNKFSGKYRLPKYKIISGEKTRETIYRENNVSVKLDVERVYFSPRLGSERLRIAKLVKENEEILVMFSGSGIYPLVTAKNSNSKIIYGIEINPVAHKYALENVKLNKLENKIKLFLGDVKKILPKLNKKFDRIVMPLPKGAENYLNLALKHIKRNGFIHFYYFSDENKIPDLEETIKNICKKNNKKCMIKSIARCGDFGPGIYRVCVDFTVAQT